MFNNPHLQEKAIREVQTELEKEKNNDVANETTGASVSPNLSGLDEAQNHGRHSRRLCLFGRRSRNDSNVGFDVCHNKPADSYLYVHTMSVCFFDKSQPMLGFWQIILATIDSSQSSSGSEDLLGAKTAKVFTGSFGVIN